MSATEEVESVTAVEQLPKADVAAPETPQAAEKATKEKKPRTPKEKKPKAAKTAAHPPYFQMIKEALVDLNEKGGSSPYAIAKYMEQKHRAVLPANFRKILGLQLKNSATRGKLIKIKASYKLSEAGKRDKGLVAKATKKPKQANKSTAAISIAKRTRKSEAAVKKSAAAIRLEQRRRRGKQLWRSLNSLNISSPMLLRNPRRLQP